MSPLSKKENMARSMVSGGVFTLIIKLINTALTIGGTIVIARLIGAEQYGLYSVALSVALLLAVPAQAGLPTLLVREVAKYQALGEWGLLKGVLLRANQFSFLLSGLIITGAYFFATDPVESIFIVALAVIPIIAMGDVRSGALRGLRHVVLGQVPEMLIRPGGLLLLLALVVFYKHEVTAEIMMKLYVVAAFVAFLIGAIFLVCFVPSKVKLATPEYKTKLWVKSILPLSLLTGVQVVNSNTDIVMLGALASNESAGLYKVAVQGATLVTFFLYGVNMAIAPYFSRLYTQKKLQELQKTVSISGFCIFIGALPVVAVLVLFGEFVLSFFFGEVFAASYSALVVLSLAQLVSACFGSVVLLLNMSGNESEAARGVLLSALINIILNYQLIPVYGALGAAYASFVSTLIWNLLLFYSVKKRLSINTFFLSGTLFFMRSKNA